ncbi:MAG: hypothetical protein AAFX03_11820 [Pseudomonadota bacterium]
MSALARLQERLSAEMTPRLAYGLVALGAIGAIILFFELSDRSQVKADAVADMKIELASLQDDDSGELWAERAEAAGLVRRDWETTEWIAETAGIASAAVQIALTDIINAAGWEAVRISVASDPTDFAGQSVLRFEVSGVGDSYSFLAALVGLSTSQKRIIVNEINGNFRRGTRNRMFMAGYVPYRPITALAEATPVAEETARP